MYSETKKYTEEIYISKEELSKQVSGVILEEVWKQIESYRALFRKTYVFGNRKIQLVLYQRCMEEMLEATTLLFQFKQPAPGSALLRKAYFLYGDALHWAADMGRYAGLRDLSHSEYEFLESQHIPLLIRIFFLFEFCDDASLWGEILFLKNNCQFPVSFIHRGSAYKKGQCDMTKEFEQFLHALYRKILQYKGSLKMCENKCEQSLTVLREQYPQLQKEVLSFYVHHRDVYHAYTIRQYVEFHDVCYETARCAMEKLKEYRFYVRRKVGKRFVYECC